MRMLLCSIGSKQRERTLRFGIAVARALSADVMLLGITQQASKAEGLRQTLAMAAQELAEAGLPSQVRVEVGNAEQVVGREMARTTYDLLALGALASKRSRKRFLAPVVSHIIEQARTSVLVIKGERESLSRVLICASGSEIGHLAVWAGAALACGAGARATLLHVVDAMPAMYVGLEQMEETLAEFLQVDTGASRELKWAAQVVKAECEISEVKLRRGIVVDEILRESQMGDHDVVVLGSSQAAPGLVRALMGDVTQDIVDRAQRPVLVVRPMTVDIT
jgi:nucleotide-binding universal stress UspA family protein